MYGWIWRHIPLHRWQLKGLVSLLLIGALTALLWYEVFPAVEPILPFDDVQVETTVPAPSLNSPAPALSVPAATTGGAPEPLPS